jgi:hypothetical protein
MIDAMPHLLPKCSRIRPIRRRKGFEEPKVPSALQLQLDELRKANKENELKMEEMARELVSLRALNGGQLGNGVARRPTQPVQHAQVPNPWVPAAAVGPRTSAPPAAAAKAVTKQLDLNKKLGKPKK